jgi:hypothetical protein
VILDSADKALDFSIQLNTQIRTSKDVWASMSVYEYEYAVVVTCHHKQLSLKFKVTVNKWL